MTAYFDTAIVLKLYTEEPESPAVRNFVVRRKEAVGITDFHFAECVSALRLKQFRGECGEAEVAQTVADMTSDVQTGVLRLFPVDWDEAWRQCRSLSDAHAGATGGRTLDTLHVACARLAGAREFVCSDQRQSALARRAGLKVVNPCRS